MDHRDPGGDGTSVALAMVAIPVLAGDEVVCVLTFLTGGTPRLERERDACLISIAARHLATFIERKRAEDELRRRSEELEAKNREHAAQLRAARTELDVSVSVSHDLRASVRAIDGFSRILASRYADGLMRRGRNCWPASAAQPCAWAS